MERADFLVLYSLILVRMGWMAAVLPGRPFHLVAFAGFSPPPFFPSKIDLFCIIIFFLLVFKQKKLKDSDTTKFNKVFLRTAAAAAEKQQHLINSGMLGKKSKNSSER